MLHQIMTKHEIFLLKIFHFNKKTLYIYVKCFFLSLFAINIIFILINYFSNFLTMIFYNKSKAFTLVELIVVITILSVLATVAFISFQWYAASSRDSVRLSDIKSMEKVINLYRLTNSKYPTPNAETSITYSGSTAWIQWVFGTNSYTKNTNLSDVPVDPITELPYAYSVTNIKTEYQIAAVLEWEISIRNNQTYAWEQLANAFVRWDYNGKFIRVSANSTNYLLWVPSIIASDITSVDMMDIINNNRLVYKWYNNLPASYSWSVYNSNWWFDFIPNKVILFEWDISDLESNPTYRSDFFDNLQTNYSWSTIASESNINEILTINTSNDAEVNNYVANTLNNTIKTKIPLITIVNDCNNLKWQYRTSYAFNNIWDKLFTNNAYAAGGPEYLPDLDLCDNTSVEAWNLISNLSTSNGNREVFKLDLEYWYEYNITVNTDDNIGLLIYNSDWEIMKSESFYNIWNIKFTAPKSGIYYVWLLDPYWEEGNWGKWFGFLDGLIWQTYAEWWNGTYDFIYVKNNSLARCELWETRDGDTWTCEAAITWVCSGIILNAVYSNGTTSKNIVNATHYSSLTAKYNKVPLTNSCEFKCEQYYTYAYGEPEYECKPPVSWSCTGIVDNAVYYNGNTSYALNNASYYTSLNATHNTNSQNNTCEYSCNDGYWFNWNECILWLETIEVYWDIVPVNNINVEDWLYLVSDFVEWFMAFKVNLIADTTYQANMTAIDGFWIDDLIIFDNNQNVVDEYYLEDDNFMYKTDTSGEYYIVMYMYKYGPGSQDYNFDINITNNEYIEPSSWWEWWEEWPM